MAFNKPFVYNQRIEEIAKQARTASTLEELTQICTKLNIADVIFLGKVDIMLCKYALTALYRTLRIYPELRPYINYFGTWNGFVGYKRPLFVKMYPNLPQHAVDYYIQTSDTQAETARDIFKKGNGIGLAMQFGITYGFNAYTVGAILINGKTFVEDKEQEMLQRNEEAGFHPKGCGTIKSVIDHELGHMLDYVLGVSKSYEFQQYISRFSVKEIRYRLSEYCVFTGQPDPMEVVAEAYAEYRNNPNPREIAMTIGQMIDEAYCKKFNPQHFDTNLFRKKPSGNPTSQPPQQHSGSQTGGFEDAMRKIVGDKTIDNMKKFFGDP